jgi:hypothetical protein
MFGSVMIMLVVLFFAGLDSAHASIGWIVYYEDAFQGKVIDTDTKEPIEGAVVVVRYTIRTYGFIESDSDVVDVKEVLTNKKGEFYIPSHIFISVYPVATGDTAGFIIYKPGYTAFDGFDYYNYFPSGPLSVDIDTLARMFKKGVTVELKRLRSDEERRRNMSIGFSDMTPKKLPLFYRAINEERKHLKLKGGY